jgi:DNA-directed RNA polymerase specialized sigma24 family protein
VSIAERISAHLPYLRRFARALTGSQKSGDAYVVCTLEAIIADQAIFPAALPPRVALYRTFLRVLSSVPLSGYGSEGLEPAALAAAKRLDWLAPKTRQAFLLVAAEEFPPDEAAAVLDVSADQLQELITGAGREIAKQIATDVIIIEDEPLIALDLVELVTDLGHRVVDVARTAQQAVDSVRRARPGLIMADVQLADGSSGLDAVNEILHSFSVPAIFVTAFPQQLFTGTRPEPTFVITKPFRNEHLQAVISQALFFDVRSRPEQPQFASAG